MEEPGKVELTELQKLNLISVILGIVVEDQERGGYESVNETRQCLAYVLGCIHTHNPPSHQSRTVTMPLQEIAITQG